MLRDRKLPQLATELIAELDAMYPERCLRIGETVEEHLRLAGKRDLIQFLRTLEQESRDNDKVLR